MTSRSQRASPLAQTREIVAAEANDLPATGQTTLLLTYTHKDTRKLISVVMCPSKLSQIGAKAVAVLKSWTDMRVAS